jgi:hypothetical protein
VLEALGLEECGRVLDGPPLHVARRVERRAVGGADGEHVERAAGGDAELLAAQEHVADLVGHSVEAELAAPESTDGAVRPIRAEHLVDVMEPGQNLNQARRTGDVVVDVDADGHAHDLLDVVVAGHVR